MKVTVTTDTLSLSVDLDLPPEQIDIMAIRFIDKMSALARGDRRPSRKSSGGHARAAALSPDERTAIAKTAANARWGKTGEKD